MKNNLQTYENRVLKLNHRLKHLNNDVNEFKELNKEIERLNKIIKSKIEREKYFKWK